jgi:hypothetical protein
MVNKQADSFHGELWFFTQRSGKIFIKKIQIFQSCILAHKVTELKRGSEEVNVSYSDPEHQSCRSVFYFSSKQFKSS